MSGKKKSKKSTGKRRAGGQLCTEMELAYVAAWKGDDTEAARIANYKHPNTDAVKLMKKPAILALILEKQRAVAQATAKDLGEQLRDVDEPTVIEGLRKLADTSVMLTGNVSGQVKAWETIARIKGYIINKHEDLTDKLKAKSKEELKFIAAHGRDPVDTEELQRFIRSSSGNPSQAN